MSDTSSNTTSSTRHERSTTPVLRGQKDSSLPPDACGSCCWCLGTDGMNDRCPHHFRCCRNCDRCHPRDFHDIYLGGDRDR